MSELGRTASGVTSRRATCSANASAAPEPKFRPRPPETLRARSPLGASFEPSAASTTAGANARRQHTSRSARSWECQRHLPWGSVPFGEISAGDSGVLVYLTSTFRSRSFSLPQRLTPTRTSWLCFAPHPPLGLRPPELLPHRQPWHLSALDSLMSFRSGSRRPGPSLAHRLRLQSLHPAGRPTPIVADLAQRRAAALLVFLPFEACRIRPRGLGPPLSCFASQLHDCVETPRAAETAAPQGMTVGTGDDSEETSQPP